MRRHGRHDPGAGTGIRAGYVAPGNRLGGLRLLNGSAGYERYGCRRVQA
jgi:hypothetical protein